MPLLPARGSQLAGALSLVALLALAAAVFVFSSSAQAQIPGDLEVAAILIDDADNVVPPGSTNTVGAQIRFSGAAIPELTISEARLRIIGNVEFEDSGRSSRGITDQQVGSTGSLIGAANAVQAGFDHDNSAATDPVTLTVVGARAATAHGYTSAGAVYVFEGTELVATLTAGDSANAHARFGQAVDVAGGVIVVGAPAENNASRFTWHWRRADYSNNGPVGAVHVFEKRDNGDGTRSWQRVAKLMPVDHPKSCELTGERPFSSRPDQRGYLQRQTITDFGNGVAVSDDGSTIAVHARPPVLNSEQTVTCANSSTALTASDVNALTGDEDIDRWRNATGWVFSRGSGWSNAEINDTGVATLHTPSSVPLGSGSHNVNRHDGAFIGDLDISGDGTVVAIGHSQLDLPLDAVSGVQGGCHSCEDRDHGGVTMYDRGSAAWSAFSGAPTAVLNATGDSQLNSAFMPRIGSNVVLDASGDTLVAGAGGRYSTVRHATNNPNNAVNPWKGAALVWVKPSGAWANDNDPNALLTDADSHPADLFGRHVAISDSGDRVIAGNESDSEFNYRRGEAHVFEKSGSWADNSAASMVLSSPQYSARDPETYRLAFGAGPAIDGENTVVIGQFEAISYLNERWVDGVRQTNLETGPGRAWLFDLSSGNQIASQATGQSLAVPVSNCTPDDSDDVRLWVCDLYFGEDAAEFVVPTGTPDGSTFTLSVSMKINGELRTALQTVRVETVTEVASATFDFAEYRSGDRRGEQYPSTISAGQQTMLRLSLLNENDAASAKGSVSSILLTTNSGALTSSIGGGCEGGGGLLCHIPVAALNTSNSDDIRVALEHPGAAKAGRATVRATVVAANGDSYRLGPINVVFAGAANALAISEPDRSLLNTDTCDTPAASGPSDCRSADDQDNRDVLTVRVTATDTAGNDTAVPSSRYNATISGPDEKRVPSSAIAVTWPLRRDGEDDGTDISETDPLDTRDGAPQAQLNVNASGTSQLANGEYTLELRAGKLTATQTFRVSGGPATIALGAPEPAPALNGQVTLTATVADAAGEAVPDDTPISWVARSIGTMPVLVQLAAERQTSGGTASARYLVVDSGGAYVTATVEDIADVRLIQVGTAPTAPIVPTRELSVTTAESFTVWLSERPVMASSLLPALGDVAGIWQWTGRRWVGFSVVNGLLVPGSIDFEVQMGNILWISSGN